MSFSGGRRAVMYSSIVVLLIISVLHIWVFSENKAEAIRILQEKPMTDVERESQTDTVESRKNQTEIFREYFNARLSDLNTTENGTFIDSKRRIPSCPDPLHNK
ncbi:CLAVATA3/ESR (CLE)-related protein 43 [Abeliophyllum distichum]|uniref:CLAVATA3/ESR (CLE)-related protein 43 n=1 Tax=Abeliophyllum distichum TaxID=126358 RepID=A0ABD1RD11_9LAMI